MKLNKYMLVLASVMAVSGSALAATSGGTLTVGATTTASCTVNSPTLTFSSFDPTAGTEQHASATLNTTCSTDTTPVVTFANGTNYDSTNSSQAMLGPDGTTLLDYALHSGSYAGSSWDNSTYPAIAATGSQVSTTIYGVIPSAAQTGLVAGAYSDSVAITLTY